MCLIDRNNILINKWCTFYSNLITHCESLSTIIMYQALPLAPPLVVALEKVSRCDITFANTSDIPYFLHSCESHNWHQNYILAATLGNNYIFVVQHTLAAHFQYIWIRCSARALSGLQHHRVMATRIDCCVYMTRDVWHERHRFCNIENPVKSCVHFARTTHTVNLGARQSNVIGARLYFLFGFLRHWSEWRVPHHNLLILCCRQRLYRCNIEKHVVPAENGALVLWG